MTPTLSKADGPAYWCSRLLRSFDHCLSGVTRAFEAGDSEALCKHVAAGAEIIRQLGELSQSIQRQTAQHPILQLAATEGQPNEH